MTRAAALLVLLSGLAAGAGAQQPFVSDDAEVTPRRQWHVEYYNEYVLLSRNAAPDIHQDTNNFVVQYGLLGNLEVNVDFPLIAIDRSHDSALSSAFGLGDVDFAFKYRLVAENVGGARPAIAVIGAIEVPTGNKSQQLGSGFTDYVLNSVLQKTFSETTVVHFNAGYQFSGNTLTGAIGIRTPGHIVTSGLSVAHDFSSALRLGVDLNGAQIRTPHSVDRQLQLTAGGNYRRGEKTSIDVAVLAGWFNSPRVGLLVGVSFSP